MLLDELIDLVKLNERIIYYEIPTGEGKSSYPKEFQELCNDFLWTLIKSIEKVNNKNDLSFVGEIEDQIFDEDQDHFKSEYRIAKQNMLNFIDLCSEGTFIEEFNILQKRSLRLFRLYIKLLKRQGIYIPNNIDFIENNTAYSRLIKDKEYLFILPLSVREAIRESRNCFASRQWNAGSFMILEAVEGMFSHYCNILYPDFCKRNWDNKIKALRGIETDNLLDDIDDARKYRNELAHSNKFWKELEFAKALNYYKSAIKAIDLMVCELKSQKKSFFVCVPPVPTLDIIFSLWLLKKYCGGIGRILVAKNIEEANNTYYFCIGVGSTAMNYSADVQSISKSVIETMNINLDDEANLLRSYCEYKTKTSVERKGLEYLFRCILLDNIDCDKRYEKLIKLVDTIYEEQLNPENEDLPANLAEYENLTKQMLSKGPALHGNKIINGKRYSWTCFGMPVDDLELATQNISCENSARKPHIIITSNLQSVLIQVTVQEKKGNSSEKMKLLHYLYTNLSKNRSGERFVLDKEYNILRRKDDDSYGILLPEQLVSACFAQK